MKREPTVVAVARVVVSLLGIPVGILGYVFAGVTMLGYGDSGGYDSVGALVGVAVSLILALGIPVTVFVLGIKAIRSARVAHGAGLLSAMLISGATAIAVLVAIGPFLGQTATAIANRQRAIDEQDDLTPSQLEDAVRPVFKSTLSALGDETTRVESQGGRCDTPSDDPGFGYDTLVELPYDGDAEAAERDVRAVWEKYGYVVEPGSYGIRAEGDGPVWRLELVTLKKSVQFTLTSTCVIDPSAG